MGKNSNEDLLGIFAAIALMGISISRACYQQAQSMLRVRNEFSTHHDQE